MDGAEPERLTILAAIVRVAPKKFPGQIGWVEANHVVIGGG